MIELKVGERFRASFSFAYKGPALVVNFKQIVGQWTGFGGLDPVGAMDELAAWFYGSGYQLAASTNFVTYNVSMDCTVTVDQDVASHPGIVYDMALELGTYPTWGTTIYTRFITIDNFKLLSGEGQFGNLTVTYSKL